MFPPLKKTLLQMLGPSIIFVALSLNGGEMLLWPNLAANYGLHILWPIPIILFLQYMVNIEIERYTLVTGKSVESSLVGKTKWLAIIFAVTVLVALVWPAWMTTAGNLIAHVLGFTGESAKNIGLVTAVVLMLSSIFIFRNKQSYRILEKFSKYGLIVALSIIVLAVILRFDAILFYQGLKGLLSWGYIPSDMPRFDFVAALAYGGVAGVLNLVQSEWVKEKGYGVNSLSKQKIAKINYEEPESQKNYKRWFRMINKEHFFLFVIANLFSIFLLAYLGTILLPLGSAQGFGVLTAEIDALNAFIPFLGTLFGISGILIFTMANVTILDAIGRLMHRMLVPLRKEGKKLVTSQKLSEFAMYLGVLILLSSLFIPSFKQPFFLLVLSASLSAFTMWLYPPLLLKLNYSLPKGTRPSLFRSFFVLVASLFYGFVTLWALSVYVSMWMVIVLAVVVTSYHVYVLGKAFLQRETVSIS